MKRKHAGQRTNAISHDDAIEQYEWLLGGGRPFAQPDGRGVPAK